MSLTSRHLPEILAPAGDRACLEAAVAAGADAVYFGLQGWNARARATNFSESELADAVAYAHGRGVRVYVTLNTLVFDHEIEAFERAVFACAAAGVDAVIVQDLGVCRLVRELVPGLPIHASTQMTCTDEGSARLAREAGASRVILARELSLDDIEAIARGCDIELEVFVHGALCIAYSGQCLTSEAIGGRSANRGACAQACRLPYELLVDGSQVDLGERAYLLSPQDLEASAQVPRLAAIGVKSLKIEGRLKGPAYVGATTRLYRMAVDALAGGEGPSEAQRAAALQTFTRGSGPGFLEGVSHQRLVEGRHCDHRGLQVGVASGVQRRRGKPMVAVTLEGPVAKGDGVLIEGGRAGEGELGGRVWAIEQDGVEVASARSGAALLWLGPDRAIAAIEAGRRVFKTSAPSIEHEIKSQLERAPHRVGLRLSLRGKMGERPTLSGESERGARAQVEVDAELTPADRSALDRALLEDKLGRLGDSPFVMTALEIELPERALLPLSSLNRARRALVSALSSGPRAHERSGKRAAEVVAGLSLSGEAAPAGLFVLCRTIEQARAAIEAGAGGIYLDFLELTGTGAALRELRASYRVPVMVAPPRVRKPGEEKIDRYLASLSPDGVLVRSLGALHDEVYEGLFRVGDFSLNVANRLTAHEVLARGLAAFTPSFDLDETQLLSLLRDGLGERAEVVVHHPMPLFHMEHCVYAALLSEGNDHRTCGRPCDRHKISLRDRAGMVHPVEADVGCRNTVFHGAAQSGASMVARLQAQGVRRVRIELVRESAADVRRIVLVYQRLLEGKTSAHDVVKELRAEGGYGVVRGSLRVIDDRVR